MVNLLLIFQPKSGKAFLKYKSVDFSARCASPSFTPARTEYSQACL